MGCQVQLRCTPRLVHSAANTSRIQGKPTFRSSPRCAFLRGQRRIAEKGREG